MTPPAGKPQAWPASDPATIPDTSPVVGVRRMAAELRCGECPEIFTSPTRWTDYARHLRDEHPEPSGDGGEESPVTSDEICPVPNCGKEPRHKGRHRNQGSNGNGGGPAVATKSSTISSRAVISPTGHVDIAPVPDPRRQDVMLAFQLEAATEALDRFGWHLEDCPAYDPLQVEGDGASDLDNRKQDCTCGFREAVKAATS